MSLDRRHHAVANALTTAQFGIHVVREDPALPGHLHDLLTDVDAQLRRIADLTLGPEGTVVSGAGRTGSAPCEPRR